MRGNLPLLGGERERERDGEAAEWGWKLWFLGVQVGVGIETWCVGF